jgi:hypothetical protein
MGDVFKDGLAALWRSPAVQDFRAKMLADGCAEGCYNHSLYEFSQSTGLPFGLRAPVGAG